MVDNMMRLAAAAFCHCVAGPILADLAEPRHGKIFAAKKPVAKIVANHIS